MSAIILVSNLQMYDSLLHQQDSAKNVRYPRASNIFIYFSSIIDTKIGYLKLGVGLLNSSKKQRILDRKANFVFSNSRISILAN